MLAAVRSATAGTDAGRRPRPRRIAGGRWLFSHNGVLDAAGRAARGRAGRAALPPGGRCSRCQARSATPRCCGRWCSAHRLRAGRDARAAALRRHAGRDLAAQRLDGRFNLLLTDGETIAATAAGDTLCYRHRPGGVVVASEPCDDEPGWAEVPDGSLLEATAAGVRCPAARRLAR